MRESILKKAGNKLTGRKVKMLLCTLRLLNRFLCLTRQDLAPVTNAIAAALLDYFPETEPELGGREGEGHTGGISTLAAGQRVCGGTGLEEWPQKGPANPYVGMSRSRSLLQGVLSGPVFSYLSPNCAFHPNLAAPCFFLQSQTRLFPVPKL